MIFNKAKTITMETTVGKNDNEEVSAAATHAHNYNRVNTGDSE